MVRAFCGCITRVQPLCCVFLIFNRILFAIYQCFDCMYVCMTVYHVCSVHKGQAGRGHPSPGTGVTAVCVLPGKH